RARRPAEGRADRGGTSSPQAAETELRAWAMANARRDDAIRAAAAAGVSLPRIQEITGIARTTIMRILGAPPRPAPRRPSEPACLLRRGREELDRAAEGDRAVEHEERREAGVVVVDGVGGLA